MGQALTLSDPLRVILHGGALPVAWQGQLHGDMGLECASFYAHVPHGAGCPAALNNNNPFALSLSKRCAPRQRLCTPGARPLSRTRVGRRHALAHEKH